MGLIHSYNNYLVCRGVLAADVVRVVRVRGVGLGRGVAVPGVAARGALVVARGVGQRVVRAAQLGGVRGLGALERGPQLVRGRAVASVAARTHGLHLARVHGLAAVELLPVEPGLAAAEVPVVEALGAAVH